MTNLLISTDLLLHTYEVIFKFYLRLMKMVMNIINLNSSFHLFRLYLRLKRFTIYPANPKYEFSLTVLALQFLVFLILN